MEVAIGVRSEENDVARLHCARVQDAVNYGADIRHRIDLSYRVL